MSQILMLFSYITWKSVVYKSSQLQHIWYYTHCPRIHIVHTIFIAILRLRIIVDLESVMSILLRPYSTSPEIYNSSIIFLLCQKYCSKQRSSRSTFSSHFQQCIIHRVSSDHTKSIIIAHISCMRTASLPDSLIYTIHYI